MSGKMVPCHWCKCEVEQCSTTVKWVQCPYCGACGPDKDTPEEAISAWNGITAERDRLRGLLSELFALVNAECPSLLDEDSGGNPNLYLDIREALGGNP